MAEISDEQVARLERLAGQLALRVRDYDPEDNGRWLAEQLPNPADWFRLVFVLATAIPDDRSWTSLPAWTRLTVLDEQPKRPTPAGTMPKLCRTCDEAVRGYNRERRRRVRRAAKIRTQLSSAA